MKRLTLFLASICFAAPSVSTGQQIACSLESTSLQLADVPVGNMAAGDIDGDLDVDLVAAVSQDYVILENDGTGNFSNKFTIDTNNASFNASQPILADMDGDQDLDLVIDLLIEKRIAIRLNNGDGTFANPIGFERPTFIAGYNLADLDGDLDVDIVVVGRNAIFSSAPGFVEVFLNNRDATFELGETNFAPGLARTPILKDFDNDGTLDILSNGNFGSSIVFSFYTGIGDGTFMDEVRSTTTSTVTVPNTGDMNGDGNLDIIGADFQLGVFAFFGLGDGTFAPPVPIFLDISDTGYRPEAAIFDMDNDSDLDIVMMDGSGDKIDVLFNDGQGSFEFDLLVELGNSPNSIPLADFNGDGTLDVSVSHSSGNIETLFFDCRPVLLGDVDLNGVVNILDVAPFVELLSNGSYQIEADVKRDNSLYLLDVMPFVDLLTG